MIHLFRCHLQSSFLLDLHSYSDYHKYNKIDLISEKQIFSHNQDIVMQYSCFRFNVIISANTE